MIKFFSDLFSENGNVSMMRVMSIICCIAAVAIAIIGLNKAIIDYSGISLLVTVFLSAAFGGKVMQKRIEVNGAKDDIEATIPHAVEKVKVDNPD